MKTMGVGFYWNDLEVGFQFKTVGRTVTETDIINFVNCTGMVEVMFTNVEFLKSGSSIKGRVAPAALVFGLAEGLLIQSTMQETGLAFLNMELDVKKPVVAGDTIHVECEITEVRATSKGNRGLVRSLNKVVNQKDEVVLTYTPLRLLAGHD
ncbi:MAG: MaoC family dehydratase N-terminal domain-containing protein [Kiloniellales bacterium]